MTATTVHALGCKFLHDLKGGILAPLTDAVRSDTGLCLELRGQSINVYYRGGSLMRVSQSDDVYCAFFDKNYFKNGENFEPPDRKIRSKDDINKWLDSSGDLKQSMDRYLGRYRKEEREIQQTILRENNFGTIARSTDYYICDIEYRSEHGQFDMVAVHWPSEPQTRKKSTDRRLVFIEVKHGDGALEGDSGVHAHIRDLNEFLGDPNNIQNLKYDMVRVFNQKRELDLIDCGKDLATFSDDIPLLLLVFVNHDPEKSKLRDLLHTLPCSPHAELGIVTASLLGYGFYDQGIHPVDETLGRFRDYI